MLFPVFVAEILALSGSFYKVWIIGFRVLNFVVSEHRVQDVGGELASEINNEICYFKINS